MTDSMTMVERVARAICPGNPDELMYTKTQEDGALIISMNDLGAGCISKPIWRNYIPSARAAIASMLLAPDSILASKAVDGLLFGREVPFPRDVFNAILDAALSEDQAQKP